MSQLDKPVKVRPAPGGDGARSEGGGREQIPSVEAQELNIEVSEPRFRLPSVVLATIGVLAVLVLAYLTYRLLPVMLLIFVSMLFATAIEPLVNWLRRGPFNRSVGILTVYTSLFLVIGAIGYVTVPVIFNQVGE